MVISSTNEQIQNTPLLLLIVGYRAFYFMIMAAKEIILDELYQNSHPIKVEDVIFLALEHYAKSEPKLTWTKVIAYHIVAQIKEAQKDFMKTPYGCKKCGSKNYYMVKDQNDEDDFNDKCDDCGHEF